MSHSKRLVAKCCVITGAASGIGQGIAILFAEHGANLVLIDIADCNQTISKIDKSLHKNIMYIKCDISNEINIISAAKLIKQRFVKVDVLINNAARFIFHSVLTASDQDWNDTLSVNIKGHALMLKHIVPIMKKGSDDRDNIGGSIVMMGSISSFIAQPKCITYSATKAAMLQITKNSALDLWNDYKIRVNAVCPGTIFTPASLKEMKGHNWSFKEWEKIKSQRQIIKRTGTTREVAFACLFFASDESNFCTGTSLMVDGGETAFSMTETVTDEFQQKYENRPDSLKDWDAHPIITNLFLGDFDAAQESAAIKYFNIKAQLTILNKLERKCMDDKIIIANKIDWKWIEWDDTFHELGKMQKHLITAADFIHQQISNNKCIIVHCWAGVSRSSSMIIAYLIKYQHFIFRDALVFVRNKRSKIYPNASFVRELKLFQENKGLLPMEKEQEEEVIISESGGCSCTCLIL